MSIKEADVTDPLDRLRRADPVRFVGRGAGVGDPPPSAVRDRIMTEAPPARRRPAARRVVSVAVAAAAAAVAALALLSPAGHGDLAQRAYAKTAPRGAVVFTEETTETVGTNGFRQRNHTKMWQHGDRMHNELDIVVNGKRSTYEQDVRGGVMRTLRDGMTLDVTRIDGRGWHRDPGHKSFALRTVVDDFRARIESLTDAGETTFAGRRARAYREPDATWRSGSVTYHQNGTMWYVDVETALPLGSVMVTAEKVDPDTHRPIPGGRAGQMRVTRTINHFERLSATPANLALLDAPAIDAADR